MTAKQATRLLFALATVLLCVADAQQQAQTNRTISYFTKNDSKYGELITAFGDDSMCATVDVDVHDGDIPSIYDSHDTWLLLASPKTSSLYKKYRYNYVLVPPGTKTKNDMVWVVSNRTPRGLAERVCTTVTGMSRGARIHVK
jgi:hypothetical protein